MLLRRRPTHPEDPEWLRFWAPIGEAVAVSASACRWVAESSAVPRWVSGSAVVGFYLLPIAAALVVGKIRLRSVPDSRRRDLEARFRRRVYAVRWRQLRGAELLLGLLVVGYALFAVVALALG